MKDYFKRVVAYQVNRFADCYLYAFVQGFYERATEGDSAGRTHETDQGWNEAYDRGMNLADRLVGEPA